MPAGHELVYRKLSDVPFARSTASGEPFTSAEVEQITAVLRERVHTVHPSWGVSAVAEPDGFLHVLFPDAPSGEAALALRPKLEVLGHLSFEGVADDSTPGWDERAERKRLIAWQESQSAPTLDVFNALAPDRGGPPPFVRWREVASAADLSAEERAAKCLPCVRMEVLHADRDWDFGSQDLGEVFESVDESGWPAIGFAMKDERRKAFGDFTEAYTGMQIAIVLDGKVVSAPRVNERLSGSSIIQGRFEQSEVDALIAALKSGPLPVQLEFVASAKLTR